MRFVRIVQVVVLPSLSAWLGCNTIIGLELGEPEELGNVGGAGASSSGQSTGGPGGTGGASTASGGAGGAPTTTVSVTSTGTGGGGGMPTTCPVFLPTSPWNTDISNAPVDARSDDYITFIGTGTPLHPDFGPSNGIPYVNVDSTVPKIPVSFQYSNESDVGPYPIPANPPVVEDGYILMVHEEECVLYELIGWQISPPDDAAAGAIWDLKINATRPAGWISADSAGLPIYPGLVRYEEAIVAGEIKHALRFSTSPTQHAYVAPANHSVGGNVDPNAPPMGLRLRLRPGVTIAGATPEVQAIVTALKKYGMFLASNGGDLYLSGAPHPSWNQANIQALSQLQGGDFEAIETGPLTTLN